MSKQVDSLCAVYATIIETELQKSEPDMGTINKMLEYIKTYCGTVSFPPGETPEHLEPYTIDEGAEETGVVVVDGKKIPASARTVAKRREGGGGK
ncbi:MAG: hypothetical protein ABEI86_14395 [Halobacteriaceae archaeon]